jgi:hypothetical protein
MERRRRTASARMAASVTPRGKTHRLELRRAGVHRATAAVGSPETQITRHHFPAICDGRAEVPGIPFSAGESHSVADLQRSAGAERVRHHWLRQAGVEGLVESARVPRRLAEQIQERISGT